MSHSQANHVREVLRAADFAAHRHRDQRRKDVESTPYINHPLQLAQVLAELGGVTDHEVLMAALLHDTIEDTETTGDEIEQRFGPRVRGIVEEVTDDKRLDKQVRKDRQITSAPHKSTDAKLVKLADKLCNLRDLTARPPTDWDAARRQAYFEWAAKVVAGLRGTNAALEAELDVLFARAGVEV